MNLRLDEIIGMIFKYLKQLGERNFNTVINNCVITVPSHWEFPLRRLLADAAEIGGLKVLSIVNDNTAAATYFAYEKAINTS